MGTEGHDILSNVERAHFTDISVAFDIDANAGQAYRLYEAAFNRQADNEGLGFWIKALDNGTSLTTVASGFTHSAEFEPLYGANSSDDDYINTLYNNVLDRDADQGGHDFWFKHLDAETVTREQLLIDFSESDENHTNTIATIGDKGIEFTPFIA